MTKTKPETKQEMAEWLAENVLGWTYYAKRVGEINCDAHWERPENLKSPLYTFEGANHLVNYIDSPDGFFAVWDAFHKDKWFLKFTHKCDRWYCEIREDEDGEFITYKSGKDRYEAFYNAVYEAMK